MSNIDMTDIGTLTDKIISNLYGRGVLEYDELEMEDCGHAIESAIMDFIYEKEDED